MKDAFGGAFMLRVFLIFILVYIIFTAIALNYAKAFKVKNLVVAYLEDNEILDIEHMPAAGYKAMADYFEKEILGNYHYTYALKAENCRASEHEYCFQPGIKIKQIKPESSETNKIGVYYKVTTYFGFNIGFLRLLSGTDHNGNYNGSFGAWEISGETRLIAREKIGE